MKKFVLFIGASASAILLSACAVSSDIVGGSGTTTALASGSAYCHKDRLNNIGSSIECNWTSSASDACERSVPVSRIAKDAIANDPVTVKRCGSGQWLVQVTKK